MTTPDQEFAVLIQGIRDGSEAAFEQLLELYGQHIFRVVRRKLAPAMRSKFDSADFVQSIWAAFFENRQRLVDCPTAKELINFLIKMAGDRVVDERRRCLTFERQNVNREVPLVRSPNAYEVPDRRPTPSQVAIAGESLQRVGTEQQTRIRLMVLMKLEGATHEQIAETLGIAPKTVQRAFRRLQREAK